MAVWSVMPTSLGGSAGSSRGSVPRPRPRGELRAPHDGGRRYPNRRLRREGRRSRRRFPVLGSLPVTTNPGVDWYRRYGLTCRSESGSVQGRCRLPDGMATRRDARESARQCMLASAGVPQKGCAGKTAEERTLLCLRTACKFDAATARRLTALPAAVSDPDRLAEIGDLIIECEKATDPLARVTTGGRFQHRSAGAGGPRAVRSAGASLPRTDGPRLDQPGLPSMSSRMGVANPAISTNLLTK